MPLDITEYESLARDARGDSIPVGQEPAINVQQITPTVLSTASQPFSESTRFVRLHTDVTCRIEFRTSAPGIDPVATAGSQRLPAGATEYFGVRPGYKIAAIVST